MRNLQNLLFIKCSWDFLIKLQEKDIHILLGTSLALKVITDSGLFFLMCFLVILTVRRSLALNNIMQSYLNILL